MTKIYTAKELADIVEDPTAIESWLEEITALAHGAAMEGKRSLYVDIDMTDQHFKPITDRLGELGYQVEYYDGGQREVSYIEITW